MAAATACAACDVPLARGHGVLLPCLHLLCCPCADAEMRDGRGIVCPFPVEDGLPCGERAKDEDGLRCPVPPNADDAAADEAILTALRRRSEELTVNIRGLAGAMADLRKRGAACEPAIKALSDQRDTLLVLRSRFQAALVYPSHAAHLLDLHLSMELAAKTAPHPERGVDFVYVNGYNQLLFRSHARDYRKTKGPVRTIGGKDDGSYLFAGPWGLTIDLEGNLVVGDGSNKRIQIITQQGQHVRNIPTSSIARTVVLKPNGSIWATIDRSKLNLFNALTGVVERTIVCPGAVGLCRLDDGALIASCWSMKKIVCFNPDGTQRWSSTGQGFSYARGVVAIPDLQLAAICDQSNNRVQLLSLQDGQFVRSISLVTAPNGILFDPVARNLVISEAWCISAWTLDGQLVHRWGEGSVDFVFAMTIAADGTLFVSDTDNHRIVVF